MISAIPVIIMNIFMIATWIATFQMTKNTIVTILKKINDCLTKRNTHKTLYIIYVRTEPSRHMMIQSNCTTCQRKNNKFRTKSKESRLLLKNCLVFGIQYGLSDLKESFDTEPTRSVRFDNTQMSKSMPTLVNTTKYYSQSCVLQ